MSYLQNALMQKEKELTELIQKINKTTPYAPEGRLRISHSKGKPQYYFCKAGQGKCSYPGEYLSKNKIHIARNIAQKDYDCKVLEIAERALKEVQKLLRQYQPEKLEHAYDALSDSRKEIIVPRVLSDCSYVKRWMEQPYSGKPFSEQAAEIYTDKGERVRSKSEKIIADMLYKAHVPYLYEKPLLLNGFGFVYPDFTVLNTGTRKEYYWEHMGMMDNAEYVEKALNKVETYGKNGILPGKNLLLTHETLRHPLNTTIVNEIIREFLLGVC